MEFHTFTLSNGIRVIHKHIDSTVSHCGLIVNAGSRDELPHQEGLAHYIEHCIFKGTKKRKTFHILSRLDSVGGEINAYTTKEETWVYASCLNVHIERSIELISDICFNSSFPEKEIQREKDVIIDEINSYLDTPSERIFDDFEESLYAGHPLGRNILGTEESVKSFRIEDIREFMQRCYRCDQLVFSVVSGLATNKLKRLCEKYLGNYQTPTSTWKRIPFNGYKPKHESFDHDTIQTHYVLGNEAYNHNHPYRTGMVLINNMLGGPAMNSRLNLSIREKHGIAYNIESVYQPYVDTGIFQIYLGTDPKSFEKSRRLVNKELKLLKEKALGTWQLHNAREQLIGQVGLAQESGVGNMLAFGKSFLLYNRVDSLPEVFEKIRDVSAKQILEISNEVFEEKMMSSMIFEGN